MWFAFALLFLAAAFYQAGRAEYWKRRAVDPFETAWRDFEKRQGLADPRHPSSPRSLPR